MGIVVLALMALNWGALAAFVGMAVFLATQPGLHRRGVYLGTAVVILIPTAGYLDGQDFSRWLDDFIWSDVGGGHAFYAGPFALNAAFFGGMVMSFFGSKHLPDSLQRPFHRTILYSALPSLLWVVPEHRGLFLAPILVPDTDSFASRLAIITCFLLVSFGTYCLFAAAPPHIDD